QEYTGNRVFFNSEGTQSQENADVLLDPVYRIKEGIKQKQIRDLIRQALNYVTFHEWLTDELREKSKLETLDFTLNTLH
ncbi:DNA helicase RecG, partial [Staphylococcus aureus]